QSRLWQRSSQTDGAGKCTSPMDLMSGPEPEGAVQRSLNQLRSAVRKLPKTVQDQGVTVRKTGDTNILTIAFVSTAGSMDKPDIAYYVARNIQDPLSRFNGLGDLYAYGSQYLLRIGPHPAHLNSFQMTTKDVT
ncbi:efflux RND transporter permease subunit, partial [Salmonella enterica]|uniref:efflux RND transporter permease subunit n=1 Tax=Salmonella enterica TaxID=28901 RepID=UPI00398C4609